MGAIDPYLDRVRAHLDLPEPDREQVIAELRSHLHDAARDLQAAQPARSGAEIEQQAVASLGDPAALALAYGPGGRVELRDAEGRTILRFSQAVRRAGMKVGQAGAAVGRETGRALRTTIIVLLVAFGVTLASATVLTVVLFDDVAELVRSYDTETVHTSSDHCAPEPCTTSGPVLRSFYVHPEAKNVQFALDVRLSNETNGTFHARVIDPTGNVVLERSWMSGRNARVHDHETWAPTTGVWRVEYTFDGFAGHVNLRVSVLGLPS